MPQTNVKKSKMNNKVLIIIFAVLFAAIGGVIILRSNAATLANREVAIIYDGLEIAKYNKNLKIVEDNVNFANAGKSTKVIELARGEKISSHPFLQKWGATPIKTCFIVNASLGKTDATATITSGATKKQVIIKPRPEYQNICVAYSGSAPSLGYDIQNVSAAGGWLRVYQIMYYGQAGQDSIVPQG